MAAKPNRHERRAAEKTDQSIKVPHVRANDYREFHSDGAMVRVDNQFVTLTHFINDVSIQHENMELLSQVGGIATYNPIGVEEMRFRTDVCAVRIPIATFQEVIKLYNSQLALIGNLWAGVQTETAAATAKEQE